MKKILLVEHAPHRADGFETFVRQHQTHTELLVWHCAENATPPDVKPDGLLLTGGPMMVGDLHEGKYPFYEAECEIIRAAIEADIPVLGICLGSQILCDLFGGSVVTGEWVIGWNTVVPTLEARNEMLFNGVEVLTTMQLHRDHLDKLPPGALPLAFSEHSRHEAFRVSPGSRAWGCVFHPEFEVDHLLRVFDQSNTIFSDNRITRDSLSPLDDGRRFRHALLRNFFNIVATDLHDN